MANLGDRVKDRVTGFSGIVTGRFEYLSGCLRMMVESSNLDSAGKTVDATFDEDRLEVVEAGAIQRTPSAATRLGGPRDTPTRHSPTR